MKILVPVGVCHHELRREDFSDCSYASFASDWKSKGAQAAYPEAGK